MRGFFQVVVVGVLLAVGGPAAAEMQNTVVPQTSMELVMDVCWGSTSCTPEVGAKVVLFDDGTVNTAHGQNPGTWRYVEATGEFMVQFRAGAEYRGVIDGTCASGTASSTAIGTTGAFKACVVR